MGIVSNWIKKVTGEIISHTSWEKIPGVHKTDFISTEHNVTHEVVGHDDAGVHLSAVPDENPGHSGDLEGIAKEGTEYLTGTDTGKPAEGVEEKTEVDQKADTNPSL